MTLEFDDFGRIQVKGNKFRICHCFTHAVLLALSKKHIKVDNADAAFYKQLKRRLDTDAYDKLYSGLIENTSPFLQSGLNDITSSGLVLFYSLTDDEEKMLQHSMICTGKFKWSGVNNSMSLGDANSILIEGTDVRQYTDIHIREYSPDRETGGWKGGEMNALAGGIYQMYFVPFHK